MVGGEEGAPDEVWHVWVGQHADLLGRAQVHGPRAVGGDRGEDAHVRQVRLQITRQAVQQRLGTRAPQRQRGAGRGGGQHSRQREGGKGGTGALALNCAEEEWKQRRGLWSVQGEACGREGLWKGHLWEGLGVVSRQVPPLELRRRQHGTQQLRLHPLPPHHSH